MSEDRKPLEEELADLEDALQDAINVEDYNLAAKIRDKVNEITDALIQQAVDGPQPFEARLAESIQKIQQLERDKEDLYSQLQRVSADFSNFQKRSRKDKERWTRDSTRSVLTSLLPALDNLSSVVTSVMKSEDEPLKQGLKLVEEAFQTALSKFDVTVINPTLDETFNPELHRALSIMHDPDAGTTETVAHVTRTGYRINDAVIRPAEVIVKKYVAEK